MSASASQSSGAVLAGGQSRRMGRTKALIEVGGAAMAQSVIAALEAANCLPVVLVGGDSIELSTLQHDVVDDLYPGEGPLGGILTALASAPDTIDTVVAVACDMPFIDAATIESLVTAARQQPEADVVVARTDRIQPGCAVWRLTATDKIQAQFASGERSIRGAIAQLRSVEVNVAAAAMVNLNSPEDIPGSSDVQ